MHKLFLVWSHCLCRSRCSETKISRTPSARKHRRSIRSGYAFSHQEGFGRLITSGKLIRQITNRNINSSHLRPGPSGDPDILWHGKSAYGNAFWKVMSQKIQHLELSLLLTSFYRQHFNKRCYMIKPIIIPLKTIPSKTFFDLGQTNTKDRIIWTIDSQHF